MNSPLIRAQTLELVLRGYLQTRGAFFSAASVKLCAGNLERACGVVRQPIPYNQFPPGY